MSTLVRLEKDGDIAVIVIDNPPVNAASLNVRQGLLACIEMIQADTTLVGAIIIGAGRTFIAGSDLKEFGQPIQEPQLPVIIAAIEQCDKPVVAAMHGTALGGGYELALACDARVAVTDTVVGLPEVTLGMIPGAGGTQRLPRLVGVTKAISIISSGVRIQANEALSLGMIDAIATGDLRSFAVVYARKLNGRKHQLRHLTPETPDCAAIHEATQAALKAGRSRPHVIAAIEAITSSANTPIDQALAREREVFQTLRIGTEASALRHLFFSERESLKHPELRHIVPRPVRRIAIVGAGTMGTGITLAALAAGFGVVLIERNSAILTHSLERIGDYYAQRTTAGRIKKDDADQQQANLSAGTDDSLLTDIQLVIEAVYEDLSAKHEVLRQLESRLPPGVILASNTSYLDLDAIAEITNHPQNVVGLHFFSPANVMRLLEVVRGTYTAPDVLATCFAVARQLGKLPILTGNAFGFIGNRIYTAYRRQCEFMLEDGAFPEQIDAAMQDFGFPMGPFAVADMSGLDIAWAMRRANASSRNNQARYVEIPDHLCEMKRFGRKTGAGYYQYPNPGQPGKPDVIVTELIQQASKEKGIIRQAFALKDIQNRVLLAMANEAALILAEGVTTRACDIDLVMVNGFGFPKWEGGPVFWACRQDPSWLEAQQSSLIAASGSGFAVGDLSTLRRLLPADRIPATILPMTLAI